MKRELATIVGLGIMALSTPIRADVGWTDYARVAELVPTATHYYEVRLPVKDNPSGCKNKSWFFQDYRAAGANKIFQVFLEALNSGLRVRVYVTGRCNFDGYSEISSVSVLPN